VPKDSYKSGMTGKACGQQLLNLIKKRMDITVRFINFALQNIELNRLLTKEAPGEDY
jgi:hypothetical protein